MHCRGAEQVIIEFLRVLLELIEHPQGCIAPLQDVGQLVEVLQLWIDDMHAAYGAPSIAVAPARRLCNRIKPGHEADHAAKVHIHAGLDQLRAHAQGWQAITQAREQCGQACLAVSRAHVRAQVKHKARIRRSGAQLKNAPCRYLGIDDDQAAPAGLHLSHGEICHFLIAPATGFALVIHCNTLECLEKMSDVGHQLRL